MAEEGTLCTNTEIVHKAGVGVSATAISEAYTNTFITNAEAVMSSICRVDWVDKHSPLGPNIKKVLESVASDLAAIYAIQWDMSGYTSRTEAEDMINVLRDSALRGLSVLRDKKTQTFILNDL